FRGNRQFSRPPWTRGASDHFPRIFSRPYLRARLRGYGSLGPFVPGQDGKSPAMAPRSPPAADDQAGLGVRWPKWLVILDRLTCGTQPWWLNERWQRADGGRRRVGELFLIPFPPRGSVGEPERLVGGQLGDIHLRLLQPP